MKDISVIVDVYKDEEGALSTVKSICRQENCDVEIICVLRDDAEYKSLKDAAQKDGRITVLSENSGSRGKAYNAGLKAATGEYVHFIKAGDIIYEYGYSPVIAKARKYQLDYMGFTVFYKNSGNKLYIVNKFLFETSGAGYVHRLLTLDGNPAIYGISKNPVSAVYKKETLDKNGISFSEDYTDVDESFFYGFAAADTRMMVCLDRVVERKEQSPDNKKQLYLSKVNSVKAIIRTLEDKQVGRDAVDNVLQHEFSEVLKLFEDIAGEQGFDETLFGMANDLYDEHPYACLSDYSRKLEYLYEKQNYIKDGGKEKDFQKYKSFSTWQDLFAVKKSEVRFCDKKVSKPKVSVVVPIYNQEDYLNLALESLCNQTLGDIEIICVNDGSKDSSMDIMKQYQSLDKRIVIIDKDNSGYGHTMNMGLDKAKGEYVGILEPDDFVKLNMYSDLYELAVSNEVDIVRADYERFSVDPNGKLATANGKIVRERSYYGKVVCTSDDFKTFTFPIQTWSGIYNREFLNKNGIRHNLTPGASYQDNGFWFQNFVCAKRVWFTANSYYMNRRDNPNSSVYSKGKFYAMTNEYNFIEEWLRKDTDRFAKFKNVFYRKKHENFEMTYRRIDRTQKVDYLYHMKEVFEPLVNNNEVTADVIGEGKFKQLREIIESPEHYHEKIRVSAVIATHNNKAEIENLLNQILSRDEMTMEVILSDGNSDDGSVEILKKFAADYDNVTLVQGIDAGREELFIKGFDAAKGEYVVFLDADNLYESIMFRPLYEVATADRADIVTYWSDLSCQKRDVNQERYHDEDCALMPVKKVFKANEVRRDLFKLISPDYRNKIFRSELLRDEIKKTFEAYGNAAYNCVFLRALIDADRIMYSKNRVYEHIVRKNPDAVIESDFRKLFSMMEMLKKSGEYDSYERDFTNYAARKLLEDLSNLEADSYNMNFGLAKNEWFNKLGISNRPYWFFYDEQLPDAIEDVMKKSSKTYRMDTLKGAYDEIEDREFDLGELGHSYELLEKEMQMWKRRYNRLQSAYEDMENSVSYKTGRMITGIPRKFRDRLGK